MCRSLLPESLVVGDMTCFVIDVAEVVVCWRLVGGWSLVKRMQGSRALISTSSRIPAFLITGPSLRNVRRLDHEF
jgi:hypothetical protein